jgi:hypothetical protein
MEETPVLYHIIYERKTGKVLCKYREFDALLRQYRRLTPDAVLKEVESLLPKDAHPAVLIADVSPAELGTTKRVDPKRECLVSEKPAGRQIRRRS